MAETHDMHSAHTEEPSGPKEPFPPFQPDTFASQLFWLAITFVVLYVLMWKVALPRVAAIFENRRRRIADDLRQAEQLKSESETTLAAYEKSLADAHVRAQKIAGETHDKLAAQAEKRRHVLEAELHDKLAAAEKAIAATKTSAMTNVRGIAVEAASAIVERLVGAAPADSAVEAAVKDALNR